MILKSILILAFIFNICVAQEFDSPIKRFLSLIPSSGFVEARIETLATIPYGISKGTIPVTYDPMVDIPYGFDIDEKHNVYFAISPYLYKYSDKGLLIWKGSVGDKGIYFSYYCNKLYLYNKDILKIYNAENFQLEKELDLFDSSMLDEIKFKTSAEFSNSYFIIKNDWYDTARGEKIRFIFDFNTEKLSNMDSANLHWPLIINCDNCNKHFIHEFSMAPPNVIYFFGQSTNYFSFELFKRLSVTKSEMHYFIFNKKKNAIKEIKLDAGIDRILELDRTFVFLNDTTFVFQECVRDSSWVPIKLIYRKFSFKPW